MNKLLKKTPRSNTNPNTEYYEQTLHELNKLRNLHNSFSFTPPPSPCSVTTPDPLSRTTSVASYSKTYSNPATPRLSSKQESWSPWRTKKKPTSSTDSVFTHSPQHKNTNRLEQQNIQLYSYFHTPAFLFTNKFLFVGNLFSYKATQEPSNIYSRIYAVRFYIVSDILG